MSRYDRAYYDRWYRNPSTRVRTPGEVERTARYCLAWAEFLLERPVRRVLDVCCGRGDMQPIFARIAPRVRYTGVDASEYVVRRYGAARNILHGHFGELAGLGLRGRFDLVICNGGIYYVPDAELRPGFEAIERLCNGLAYLEMFAIEDGTLTGDTKGLIRRPLATYKRLLARAGLTPVGMHGYVGAGLAEALAELQKGRPVR